MKPNESLDLVALTKKMHWWIVGHPIDDEQAMRIAAGVQTEEQLRTKLMLNFDVQRRARMMNVFQFLYEASEAQERAADAAMERGRVAGRRALGHAASSLPITAR